EDRGGDETVLGGAQRLQLGVHLLPGLMLRLEADAPLVVELQRDPLGLPPLAADRLGVHAGCRYGDVHQHSCPRCWEWPPSGDHSQLGAASATGAAKAPTAGPRWPGPAWPCLPGP